MNGAGRSPGGLSGSELFFGFVGDSRAASRFAYCLARKCAIDLINEKNKSHSGFNCEAYMPRPITSCFVRRQCGTTIVSMATVSRPCSRYQSTATANTDRRTSPCACRSIINAIHEAFIPSCQSRTAESRRKRGTHNVGDKCQRPRPQPTRTCLIESNGQLRMMRIWKDRRPAAVCAAQRGI